MRIKILLLVLTFSAICFAKRTLIEAPVRWRMDMYGSNAGSDSVISTGGPDRPLKKCGLRARVELQNVSSVAQKVKVFLKRGVGFEWWTKDGEDFLFTYPTSLAKVAAALGTNDIQIGSEFSIGKVGDPNDLLTLFVDLNCSINSGGNQGPCELSYDTPTATGQPLGTPFTGTALTGATGRLLHDASCSFTLPLKIEVGDDRGALMGTVGLIGNRSGGYSHNVYGEGQFKLNGGRAF